MNYYATVRESFSLVKLSGDVDLTSAATLFQLEKKLARFNNIVFDVADLEFVDATFLGFLMRLRQHGTNNERTTIELVGTKRNLQRILEVTGLRHIFRERRTSDLKSAKIA